MTITFAFSPSCKERRTSVNQGDAISDREGDTLKLQCKELIIKTHKRKVGLLGKTDSCENITQGDSSWWDLLKTPHAEPTLSCLGNAAVARANVKQQ